MRSAFKSRNSSDSRFKIRSHSGQETSKRPGKYFVSLSCDDIGDQMKTPEWATALKNWSNIGCKKIKVKNRCLYRQMNGKNVSI